MQVLFLQNVKGIGKMGEVKNVNDGYAQNFLFPKKYAEPATAEKLAKLKNAKDAKVNEKQLHDNLLLKNFESLDGKEIELHRKVNSAGGLFGSIHLSDVIDAIKATHKVHIAPEYVKIPEIRNTGMYSAKIGDKKIGREFELKIKVMGQ